MTRSDSTPLTWTLQFWKRFLFRMASTDFGEGIKESFSVLLFGFTVWWFACAHAFYSFLFFFFFFRFDKGHRAALVWVSDHSFNIFNGKCIDLYISFSQSKWCEFIRIEQKYVAKRILENTICNNEGVKVHTMQVVACVDAFWIYSVMLTVHTESPRQSVVIRCLSRNWRCNWRSLSCISEMSWMLSWYLNLSCSNEIRRRVRSTFIRKSTTLWEEEAIVLISFEWPYI